MDGWQGKDTEQKYNLEEDKYNFISNVFDREYVNKDGKNLYWLILDAGNFHNPKVCSNGAGFKVRDLNGAKFSIFNIQSYICSTLSLSREGHGRLAPFWINPSISLFARDFIALLLPIRCWAHFRPAGWYG